MMLLSLLALAAVQSPPDDGPQDEEAIVITAQRTGIPVWRVTKGQSTVVLVGTLTDIAKGTSWNAAALDSAVAQSRRVIFPQTIVIRDTASNFAYWNQKWTKMALLPADKPLSTLLDAAEQARLTKLAAQGRAPRDWAKVHPLHLAMFMQNKLRQAVGTEPDVESAVEASIKAHKVYRVPIKQTDATQVMEGLFLTKPADHLACLRATMAVAEAGPEELRRRSATWTKRQVAATVASPVAGIEPACWPGSDDKDVAKGVLDTTMKALGRKGVTLAIVNVDSLARTGGLLDRLQAAGMTIDGPTWR